jgi:hypothetical protein
MPKSNENNQQVISPTLVRSTTKTEKTHHDIVSFLHSTTYMHVHILEHTVVSKLFVGDEPAVFFFFFPTSANLDDDGLVRRTHVKEKKLYSARGHRKGRARPSRN